MSELSPLGTMNSDSNQRIGSIGPLVSSTEGKIIDPDTGKSLGPYQRGELCIKGPQVMLGCVCVCVQSSGFQAGRCKA